jgi:hypothetical protein
MLAAGLKAERLVEGSDGINVNERLTSRIGYHLQSVGGQVAVRRLDLLQDRDQTSAITLVLIEDSKDFRLHLIPSRKDVPLFPFNRHSRARVIYV